DLRRLHRRHRRGDRKARPRRAGGGDARESDHNHRPPALIADARRRDPGAGGRPRRRARHARGADRARRRIPRPLPTADAHGARPIGRRPGDPSQGHGGGGMSDFVFDEGGGRDAGPAPRRRNANLGTADAEEIFMAFDTRIMRRFAGYLKPHPGPLIGALAAVIASSIAQLFMPLMIGQAVDVATSPSGDGHVATLALPHFISASGVLQLSRIDVVVLEFVAAAIVFTLTSILSQWLSVKLAQKVIFDVRRG